VITKLFLHKPKDTTLMSIGTTFSHCFGVFCLPSEILRTSCPVTARAFLSMFLKDMSGYLSPTMSTLSAEPMYVSMQSGKRSAN
jgi:hypothetical protein